MWHQATVEPPISDRPVGTGKWPLNRSCSWISIIFSRNITLQTDFTLKPTRGGSSSADPLHNRPSFVIAYSLYKGKLSVSSAWWPLNEVTTMGELSLRRLRGGRGRFDWGLNFPSQTVGYWPLNKGWLLNRWPPYGGWTVYSRPLKRKTPKWYSPEKNKRCKLILMNKES